MSVSLHVNDQQIRSPQCIELSGIEVWKLVASALATKMPSLKSEIKKVEACCEVSFDNPITQPSYTYDRKDKQFPQVSISYQGSAADALCVAHEFGHALQLFLARKAFVSPVVREISAFVAEQFFLEHMVERRNGISRALKRRWIHENQRYLRQDLAMLADVLGVDPIKAPYNYRWNYPLARLISITLLRDLSRDLAYKLFRGRLQMPELVFGLAKIMGGKNAIPRFASQAQLHDAKTQWDELVSHYVSVFPSSGSKIVEIAKELVVDLAPNLQSSGSIVGQLSENAIFLRAPVASNESDIRFVSGLFAEALASSRNGILGTEGLSSSLGEIVAGGTVNQQGEDIQSEARSLATGLSACATFAVLSGQIDTEWLEFNSVAATIQHGAVVQEVSSICRRSWVKWRSLGVLALAAMKNGEADETPSSFIMRSSSAIGAPTIIDPNLPWEKLREFDALCALGMAVHSLSISEYHNQYSLQRYLKAEILPPLKLGQAINYVDESGDPLAFVSWAWLACDVEKEIADTGRGVTEEEWNSGPQLFCNDWISSQTSVRTIVKDVRSRFFGNSASSLRRFKNGTVRRTNRWSNHLPTSMNTNASKEKSLRA